MHHEHPELLKDQYWDTVLPIELPHTVASEQYREEPPSYSTANVNVTCEEGEIVSPPSVRSIHQLDESGVSYLCQFQILKLFVNAYKTLS
jgi:hypothetical protein